MSGIQLMFLGQAQVPSGDITIVGSSSNYGDVNVSQTASFADPSAATGDIVVVVMTVNNASAITSFGDLTGWTQNEYYTATAERILVLSTTVTGSETWLGGNIECTVAAQYAGVCFAVRGATSVQTGTRATSEGNSISCPEITPTNPSLLVVVSASDNVGSVSSVTNSNYTFTSVVESSGAVSLAGECAVYSAGVVPATATGNTSVTIDTSNGLSGLLLGFS